MKNKDLINYYPYVELPDPKVRYLVRDKELRPLALVFFDDRGTPSVRVLAEYSTEIELSILAFTIEKQRLLFGRS